MTKKIIKLEEVPLKALQEEISLYAQLFGDIPQELINRILNISNFKELKSLLESSDFDIKSLDKYMNLKSRLKELEEIIKNHNDAITHSEIELMDNIDRKVLGNALFYGCPYGSSARRAKLRDYTVYDLKQKFAETSTKPIRIRGFGNVELQKVYNSILFYDEQIKRLLDIYGYSEAIFYYLKKDKDKAVREQIPEIIEYLNENAEVCLWGELKDQNKERLLQLIAGGYAGNRQEDLDRFINNLSNYVTPVEAQKGLIKTKAINRFIVR